VSDHLSPDPPDRPDELDELDERRAARLRELLDDGDPIVDAPVPADLQPRADARRQRKVAGIGLAAALVLLAGGSAFALSHKADAGSAELGVAAPATGGRAVPTTVVGSVVVPAPDGSALVCEVPDPIDPIDPVAPNLPCEPTTSGPADTAAVDPTVSNPPTTFLPSTTANRLLPTTTIPLTTPTSPHGTQTTELPRDCGYWAPIGWPTTALPSRTLSECILGAFDAGVDARLTVKEYQGDPEHTTTTYYEVVGVHVVQVATVTTAPGQQSGGTTVRCTSLVDAWPSPSLVHADDCSAG
jgi:hypothetical protein